MFNFDKDYEIRIWMLYFAILITSAFGLSAYTYSTVMPFILDEEDQYFGDQKFFEYIFAIVFFVLCNPGAIADQIQARRNLKELPNYGTEEEKHLLPGHTDSFKQQSNLQGLTQHITCLKRPKVALIKFGLENPNLCSRVYLMQCLIAYAGTPILALQQTRDPYLVVAGTLGASALFFSPSYAMHRACKQKMKEAADPSYEGSEVNDWMTESLCIFELISSFVSITLQLWNLITNIIKVHAYLHNTPLNPDNFLLPGYVNSPWIILLAAAIGLFSAVGSAVCHYYMTKFGSEVKNPSVERDIKDNKLKLNFWNQVFLTGDQFGHVSEYSSIFSLCMNALVDKPINALSFQLVGIGFAFFASTIDRDAEGVDMLRAQGNAIKGIHDDEDPEDGIAMTTSGSMMAANGPGYGSIN